MRFQIDYSTAGLKPASVRFWINSHSHLVAVVKGFWLARRKLARVTNRQGAVFTVTED